DPINLLSGYAEILKHALLSSEKNLNEVLQFDLDEVDYDKLNDLLFESVLVKERIVEEDPKEQGIRKALNLGHTLGHAFESLSYELDNPMPHGYAVAWGVVGELYLSVIKLNFDKNIFIRVSRFVKDLYGVCPIECSHYERIYQLMQHDKKNESSKINFTFLKGVGEIEINQMASSQEIVEALDFLREGQ
ncbi:3-dehydroquinate synthase, partial [Bacteroidales bacterium OttesenSCG-928-M06]|nr:3-dehydroquinate synthase [Bacteroidales bacterium OttesenSCG-928-M06]